VAALVERIGQETGAQVLKPWFGMPWLYGGGIDVVYDTVGFPETVEVGVRLADSRGAIVITGVEAPKRFEWTPLYFKEIAVIGSQPLRGAGLGGRGAPATCVH